MFLRRLGRIGQSTAEYAIVFALVVAAAIAIQTYVKRGLQGRVRDVVNYTGNDQFVEGDTEFGFTGDQYEPYYMASEFDTERRREEGRHEVSEGYGVTDEYDEETSTRVGWQEYLAPE